MQLTTKTKKLKNVKPLYLSAFPKYERLPYFVLNFLTLRKGFLFTEYYDGEEFCGFTYTIETDYTIFIYYLAVNDKLRGKGYGSAILSHIKNAYKTKTVTLNIEPLITTADNYEARVKRLSFYQKNGFTDSGYTVDEIGGEFTVLFTKQNVDTGSEFEFKPLEFKKVFKKIGFGLWNVKVYKK